MKIYVMQDRVSGQYGALFEAENSAVVKRDFVRLCEDVDFPFHVIRDTVIFELGSFNHDITHPAIFCNVTPHVVLRGDEFEYSEIRKAAASASSDSFGEEAV